MKVPFFDYPFVYTSEEQEILEIVEDVGRRGAFILQRDLATFERRLAEFCGARHAVGVANATDGLQMGMMAAGLGDGGEGRETAEAILCSHTMVATASAIHFAGATPVPVDAGPDHLIDPEAIERAITPRTRAIVPTQLNGRTADMDAIGEIARRHDLLVFEDAAQALGSRFRGRCAGTFGTASCISFYPAKILGCLGDGGAVITDDDEVHRRLLLLRDHGREADGDVSMWGFNSRLDNLQAAILDARLERYPQVIERRREIARLYQARLEPLPELVLPPAPDSDPDHFDVFQNYEIEAEERDALRAWLADHEVGTLIQWGGRPVHSFRRLGFREELPAMDRLFDRLLMLPLNMSLTDDAVHLVCDRIEEFYRSR